MWSGASCIPTPRLHFLVCKTGYRYDIYGTGSLREFYEIVINKCLTLCLLLLLFRLFFLFSQGFLWCVVWPKVKIRRQKASHRLWLPTLPHAGRYFILMVSGSSFLKGLMCAIFLQDLPPHLLKGVEEDMNWLSMNKIWRCFMAFNYFSTCPNLHGHELGKKANAMRKSSRHAFCFIHHWKTR